MLSPEDAAWLIAKTTTDKTVLIGGQAVAFWSQFYGLESRLPALTNDIDYLGTRAEAVKVARNLTIEHELKTATMDDATPSAAVLLVPIEGYEEPIIIDYLASILGVDSRKIQQSAVTIEIESQQLKVLHPMQLLQTKIWNLYQLESKRTPEGVEQARLAIEIVARYLEQAANTQRKLLDAIEAIGRFAQTMPARHVRKWFKLECLEAIPASAFQEGRLPQDFHDRRWPQIKMAISTL
jgi:hypothetical protein